MAVVDLSNGLQSLKTVIPALSTEHKLRKAYENHPRFVKPEPVQLGQRFETTSLNGGSHIVERSNLAQYIPISKTLQSLFLDPHFEEVIFHSTRDYKDGVYTCFQDSQTYKMNPVYQSTADRKIVLLQLYYDGMSLSNPLRAPSSIHSSGMFYFTILNLPPNYNAALSNIHLLSIASSLDLKTSDGLETLLTKIETELQELGSNGLEVKVEGKAPFRVYVYMAQFTADNLGLHQIFGLVECFSMDFCCLLCYCTKKEMQSFTKESDCRLRTIESYDEDLKYLQEQQDFDDNIIHQRGIKRYCPFNNLPNFHIITNWINDIMHTGIEGFIPYLTGCVISSVASANNNFTLEVLNDNIDGIFGRLQVDRTNKPSHLDRIPIPGQGIGGKLSAAQQWALFRYMPLIIGDFVNDESAMFYELFILGQEIVDILMGHKFTDTLLKYLAILIERFLSGFLLLYPHLHLTPKFHFLLHFPSIIKKNGPPRTYMTMNYERLNGSIKTPCHIMNNFRNPQYTLAYRRQCTALNDSLERRNNREFVIWPNKTHVIHPSQLSLVNCDVVSDDYLQVCYKVKVNGTDYKKGNFVLLHGENDEILFGQIQCIICDEKEPLLSLTLFNSEEFSSLYFAHVIKIKIPTETKVYSIKKLKDFHPLDSIEKNGKQYVRLKNLAI